MHLQMLASGVMALVMALVDDETAEEGQDNVDHNNEEEDINGDSGAEGPEKLWVVEVGGLLEEVSSMYTALYNVCRYYIQGLVLIPVSSEESDHIFLYKGQWYVNVSYSKTAWKVTQGMLHGIMNSYRKEVGGRIFPGVLFSLFIGEKVEYRHNEKHTQVLKMQKESIHCDMLRCLGKSFNQMRNEMKKMEQWIGTGRECGVNGQGIRREYFVKVGEELGCNIDFLSKRLRMRTLAKMTRTIEMVD
jgi:hypothetical protein